jgi:hypothetical protein
VSTARLYSTHWLLLLFHLFLGYIVLCHLLLDFTTPSNRN